MEKQLNTLMVKLIQTGDDGLITEQEKRTIKAAVAAKATEAIASHQGSGCGCHRECKWTV